MQRELKTSGVEFTSRSVLNREDFLEEYNSFKPDVVLADYWLPSFNGMEAYRLIKHNSYTPFILVTGSLSEQMALDCVREGIDDFVLKSSFKRLPSAILNSIEKKRAEFQRDKMTNDLLQRNKDLEQFAYIISHNLRGSVANILGLFNLWDPDNRSKEEQKFIYEGLKFSVKKLDEVIKDLNYVLQVKKEINEKKEIVFFSDLIRDIKLSISTQIKKDDVKIKTDFTAAESLLTLKSYLYSIFYNLIVNSIKYRKDADSPVIEIKSFMKDGEVGLVFKDNGIGIDMERNADKIFGLYKRFTDLKEGKGMGLFMVKTQVEALGGKITVDSEVGKGTSFTILFDEKNASENNN
jgi:light-regulated signal transduction histidine kinase (bacteriophytochrome)